MLEHGVMHESTLQPLLDDVQKLSKDVGAPTELRVKKIKNK